MDATKYVQSRWLSGIDLDEKEWDLTIAAVGVEQIRDTKGKEETKLSVQFKGARKPLLVNLTNGKLLIASLGKETNNWPGAMCHLRCDHLKSFGKDTLSIVISSASKSNGAHPTPDQNAAADLDIVEAEKF